MKTSFPDPLFSPALWESGTQFTREIEVCPATVHVQESRVSNLIFVFVHAALKSVLFARRALAPLGFDVSILLT